MADTICEAVFLPGRDKLSVNRLSRFLDIPSHHFGIPLRLSDSARTDKWFGQMLPRSKKVPEGVLQGAQ